MKDERGPAERPANAWRGELRSLLEEEKGLRPPALRRSLLPDYLYASDLPRFAGEARVAHFRRRAEALGWECEERDGWLQLRRPFGAPPDGWFQGPFGPEASCCRELLRCHPTRGTDPETETCRHRAEWALIKAGEEGPEACERVFEGLHREWAERLRKGLPLPGLRACFFGPEREIPKKEHPEER